MRRSVRVAPPPLAARAAVLLLLLLSALPLSLTYTYEQDVFAINGLYTALGSPSLPGWVTNGGDPCVENWQGVGCAASNITSITLNGINLGGQLGNTLANFTSIITLELSNNIIGGTIPDNLPVTIQRFFLSGNQLSGSLPSTLSTLTLLTDMSLSSNHLSGEIPDVFSALTGLINLHIQDNQISGTLDVLQDLPLKDLNIQNNLFSGPVPPKLFNVPNFQRDGNPFNTSIAPSPLPAAPAPSPSLSPSTGHVPSKEPTKSPDVTNGNPPASGKHTIWTVKFVGYILVGVVSAVVIVLMVMFCVSKHKERKSKKVNQNADIAAIPGVITKKQKEHVIDMEKSDDFVEEPLRLPQSVAPRTEKGTVSPSVRTKKGRVPSLGKIDLRTTVKSFSVASLQQYTNSFSEENLIRDSRFGKVYLAELPDGEILEVLKIDIDNSRVPVDVFLELVVNISELSHPNILALVGYCAEFEQWLLVYEHCSKMTLHDELHYVDEPSNALSWNARLQVAVEAAKALQYLHDGRQPPLVHQNFEPSVVLLNSTLAVQISECGLASLSQLSGSLHALFHYEAPEVHESRSFSDRSDVYSFGVVMLELLTGREPYDSSRPRAEQHLVRWASTQLYDIDAITKMVDPLIRGQCSEKALSRFADVIGSCIQPEPEFRPPMSEVVQALTRMVSDATKASMILKTQE
uniref:Protein STRUBBELIG-RECEPTOR FAMILY 3 n=1 Tax=Aegilops tauschii TaxID=37682 RepID=M8B787_AEGTA